MPILFKNPKLTDYFVVDRSVSYSTHLTDVPSFVNEYEDAKVLSFPGLKLDLDFDFWASIPGEDFIKKLVCYIDPSDQEKLIDRALKKAGIPPNLKHSFQTHVRQLFEKIMPYYYAIFRGYTFLESRAVIRLNCTYNENMHYDTYRDRYPNHFARMFINLDNQPRIWHTSWTINEIYTRFGRKLSREALETYDSNRLWLDLNRVTFGNSNEWWDGEPRHVIYFEPGDVWVVDSRQVSHQIFYGRRAISIDFVVDFDSMIDNGKHYFSLIEKFRSELLG